MPGFNINGTGGIVPGTMETRRVHRWVFDALVSDLFPEICRVILQSAQRPNFKFEEPEMHHDQEVARFAGKQDWEPMTLTFYDGEQPRDVSKSLYQWVNTVVNLDTIEVAPPSEYKKQAQLSMTNGRGVATETWQLYNCWPKESNWGNLDYTATDIATIEVQMRYDRAKRL